MFLYIVKILLGYYDHNFEEFFFLINRVLYTSSCRQLRLVSYLLMKLEYYLFYTRVQSHWERLRRSHTMNRMRTDSKFEIRYGSFMLLNVKLYDRRELSGQRSCHPAQVLGVKQEISSPLSFIDG